MGQIETAINGLVQSEGGNDGHEAENQPKPTPISSGSH
jgi:hypothetical protein